MGARSAAACAECGRQVVALYGAGDRLFKLRCLLAARHSLPTLPRSTEGGGQVTPFECAHYAFVGASYEEARHVSLVLAPSRISEDGPGWRRAVATSSRNGEPRLFAKREELPRAGYQAVLFNGRPDIAGLNGVEKRRLLRGEGIKDGREVANMAALSFSRR